MSRVDAHASAFAHRGNRRQLVRLLATANRRGQSQSEGPEVDGKSGRVMRRGDDEWSVGSDQCSYLTTGKKEGGLWFLQLSKIRLS